MSTAKERVQDYLDERADQGFSDEIDYLVTDDQGTIYLTTDDLRTLLAGRTLTTVTQALAAPIGTILPARVLR